MVKTVTTYKCEICNEAYKDLRTAKKCESKGKEEPLLQLHQEVFLRRSMGGGWSDWWLPVRVGKIKDMGHFFYYELEEKNEDGLWFRAPYGTLYGKVDVERDIRFQ